MKLRNAFDIIKNISNIVEKDKRMKMSFEYTKMEDPKKVLTIRVYSDPFENLTNTLEYIKNFVGKDINTSKGIIDFLGKGHAVKDFEWFINYEDNSLIMYIYGIPLPTSDAYEFVNVDYMDIPYYFVDFENIVNDRFERRTIKFRLLKNDDLINTIGQSILIINGKSWIPKWYCVESRRGNIVDVTVDIVEFTFFEQSIKDCDGEEGR